jgi:hypothetical protein
MFEGNTRSLPFDGDTIKGCTVLDSGLTKNLDRYKHSSLFSIQIVKDQKIYNVVKLFGLSRPEWKLS